MTTHVLCIKALGFQEWQGEVQERLEDRIAGGLPSGPILFGLSRTTSYQDADTMLPKYLVYLSFIVKHSYFKYITKI
jgi:hypothetical protein